MQLHLVGFQEIIIFCTRIDIILNRDTIMISVTACQRSCATLFARKHHNSSPSDEPKLYLCTCESDQEYDYINDPDNVADMPSARGRHSPEFLTESKDNQPKTCRKRINCFRGQESVKSEMSILHNRSRSSSPHTMQLCVRKLSCQPWSVEAVMIRIYCGSFKCVA